MRRPRHRFKPSFLRPDPAASLQLPAISETVLAANGPGNAFALLKQAGFLPKQSSAKSARCWKWRPSNQLDL